MGDVVLFPKFNPRLKYKPPHSVEDIKDKVGDFRKTRIINILNSFITDTAGELKNSHDIDVISREDVSKEFALVIESVNALLCKYMHIDHSLHPYIDGMFVSNPNGRLSLRTSNELHETIQKVAETKKTATA